MNRRSANQLLVVAGAVALISVAVSSYGYFAAQRAAAAQQAESWQACNALAERILTLRALPSQASLQSRGQTELARSLDELGKQVGLGSQSILRIDPQTPQRVQNSDYQQQGTVVELDRVNLRQLTTFLVRLIETEPQLRVAGMRMSAPRSESINAPGAETWDVELTLTDVIFPITRDLTSRP